MDERQFNEFENKLKNSDEHSQPAMNDFAWSKMEAKLDDAFGKKKKRRGLLWFFLLLAIMAGSGIIFYKSRPANHLSADQYNKPIVANQKAQTTTTNQSINLKTSQPVLQASVTKNKKVIAAIFKNRTIYKSKAANHFSPASNSYNRKKSNDNSNRFSADLSTTNSKNAGDQQLVPGLIKNRTDENLFRVSTLSKSNDLSTTNNERDIALISTQLSYPVINLTALQPVLTVPIKDDADVAVAKKQSLKADKKSQHSQLFIGPTLINSFSGVRLTQASGNMAFGIDLGYSLHKWNFRTGINAGHLLYGANAENYNPVKADNLYGYKLKSVKANCYVIEIPLSVDYKFYANKRLTFFASAGVLSQIMKRENYQYIATKYDSVWANAWKYANENQHLFSMLEIGGGIDYRLTDKWLFEAAPFYKIPFEGIGHGRIKLYSAGIALSLHYLPFNRKKKNKL